MLLGVLILTACQTAPPPVADDNTVTVGDWTVTTGGYVRAETGVVRGR
jgi:hypothetical protein